jgi:hypothetical protein
MHSLVENQYLNCTSTVGRSSLIPWAFDGYLGELGSTALYNPFVIGLCSSRGRREKFS